MKNKEMLEQLIFDHKGIIRTAEALELGISKPVFYDFVRENQFEHVSHGIYVSKDAWVDAMYILSLRSKQAVFSHDTALFLHNLTDREPLAYSVTVKTGYNPSRLKEDGIKVYTIKKELYEVGLATIQTPFGNTVQAYDRERTVCDIVRSRSQMEIQTLQDALKQYTDRKDKNLRQLMKYAQKFQMDNVLNKYLEVLL